MSISITDKISVNENELEFSAIRAQGKGGQNVNKVSSAVQLRFDIKASSLPEEVKARLSKAHDKRITRDGILIIKAQNHRTQERNKADAIERLINMIRPATVKQKKRRPTRPGKAARQKRLDKKQQQSEKKALRRKVKRYD